MMSFTDDEERRFAHQILNEVVNGFAIQDFESTIGLTILEARRLMDTIRDSSDLKTLTSRSVEALRRATIVTMDELTWEFPSRVGFELTEAQAMVERFTIMHGGE